MLEIVSGAVPEFFSVVDCDELVVPTCCEPRERLVGVSVTAGAVAAPVPLRLMLCGLSEASSVTETLALRAPVADGVKVTEIVHEPPGASVAGASRHADVSPKSEGFVPVTAIALIESGAPPEFVSVTFCVGLVVPTTCPANVRLVGDSVTAGAVPVPLRPRLCGLSEALSLMETFAVRLPVADGENVTEIVQVPLTANVAGLTGQLLLSP